VSSSAIGSLYPGKRPITVHPMPDVNSPQRLSPLGWEHVNLTDGPLPGNQTNSTDPANTAPDESAAALTCYFFRFMG
jgi:hypothetical protein